MSKKYYLYIYNNKYSGYFTGEIFMSQNGDQYPGIVAYKGSNEVKLYNSKKLATQAGLEILSFQSDLGFQIYEYPTNNLIYKVLYKNGKIESEQRF